MNILSTQYSAVTKSFEVYIAGCSGNPHCINCHNKESWDFGLGKDFKEFLPKITSKIKRNCSLIDNIFILGGEPLDQPEDCLKDLLVGLKKTNKPLWLFTRNELNNIPDFVLKLCDYIKCGRYCNDNLGINISYGVPLASTNQRIFKRGVDYL